ncbi:MULTISPECIES: 5-oxoprolinase/urea amidolyase family protein [unclassified Arthrobacter]|uniref:5-oxoprolinase subunit B/C family protein n=1 Tax=unclassified Arthrobacter TaxID=235627 RepID=UPI0007013FE8|nr:5-oxoprolinase/urea amidolyase family protein [Arthrobacter sp. Leaf234]KQO03224.1 urea amidolyase [Arthrobacter sp. Leaf234]
MTLRAVGDRGLLVELPGLPEVLSIQSQLQARPADGQVDVVAAACTVLVTVRDAVHLEALAERLRSTDPTLPVEVEDTLVTIEVQYDGEDLAEVARRTGLSEDAVVTAHSSRPWTASFGGFAPGFAYLTGGDPRLEVPRRDSPRTAVPAGSVALAGAFSAVYPRESPGGWQLIGHTDAVLWDTHREQPALIRPGNRVRFVPVRHRVQVGAPEEAAGPAEPAERGAPGVEATGGEAPVRPAERGAAPAMEPPHLMVVHPGLSSTLQDLGRPGLMSLGVAEAGALDRSAARQANRLVGNAAGSAVIESLNGGLALEAGTDQVLAVTGADVGLTIAMPDGREREPLVCAPFLLRAGEVLRQSAPATGLRCYTAVRGGFAAGEVLGSRSTDSMSGLGPRPLVTGTPLTVALQAPASPVGEPESLRRAASPEVLRIRTGPRDDWFGAEGLERLCSSDWTVSAQSNRIGLRLDGPALQRTREGELPSEGTVGGALQVPPSGLPVLFLADHPVTGGYPVIAVVVSADLDRAAQLPPGSTVRFLVADP